MKKRCDLTNVLVASNKINNGFVFVESSEGLLLPIFSNPLKYSEASKWCGFEDANCIRITDHEGFTNAVLELQKKAEFKLVFNPYINENGNVCFQLITLEAKNES